jgi:hypothetical protein
MKEEIDADVYCVIDGLDEVMKDSRFEKVDSEPDDSDPMTNFLIQLCELLSRAPRGAGDANEAGKPRSFKTVALFTTRPLPQVGKATKGATSSSRSRKMTLRRERRK